MRVRHKLFLWLFTWAVALVGCRSTAPIADSVVDRGAPERMTESGVPAKNLTDRSIKFSDLALWEILPSNDENPLMRIGVAKCKLDHAYVSCLVEGQRGVDTLIDASISAGLRHKMIQQRSELEFEPRVLADVACDKTEATMPPYGSSAAQCRFISVRAFNEAVVDGDLALELLSLTRGDGLLDDKKNDSSGVVSCNISRRKISVNCSLRRVTQSGISDDARILRREDSVKLSEKMIGTLQEIRAISGGSTNNASASEIPVELAGSVRCVADDSTLESSGRRVVTCIVRM